MNLYNLIIGHDPRTPLILGMLGLTHDGLCRFIDSYPYNDRFAVIVRIVEDREHFTWVDQKIKDHSLFAGEEIDGKNVIFLFNKPERGNYTLPESFVRHFSDKEDAWNAVEYVNRSKNRPLTKFTQSEAPSV